MYLLFNILAYMYILCEWMYTGTNIGVIGPCILRSTDTSFIKTHFSD